MLADSGSQYTAGPIAIVVVLCLLALLLRWIFGTGRSRSGGRAGTNQHRSAGLPAGSGPAAAGPTAAGTGPATSGAPGAGAAGAGAVPSEFGLLRPVALLPDRATGDALRTVLSDAGIRSTLTAGPDGRVAILVFAADADRARALLPPP